MAGRTTLSIPYMYRDAYNYKAHDQILVDAPADPDERAALIERVKATLDQSHNSRPAHRSPVERHPLRA